MLACIYKNEVLDVLIRGNELARNMLIRLHCSHIRRRLLLKLLEGRFVTILIELMKGNSDDRSEHQ